MSEALDFGLFMVSRFCFRWVVSGVTASIRSRGSGIVVAEKSKAFMSGLEEDTRPGRA
jgi:hypothetical protein